MHNAENRFAAEFHDGAVTVYHAEGRLVLRLERYGYAGNLRTPPARETHAAGATVAYRSGPLTEWYRNEAGGLEQGFELRERPGASGSGWLVRSARRICSSSICGVEPLKRLLDIRRPPYLSAESVAPKSTITCSRHYP